ncbi:MAG: BMP family ABC transporter substrate-binding protein [Anaerolineae bacterium]|nr:MAG: BMP family ABC transporter substrate-binding protein [Anaerolineae bacterium]
MLSRKKWLLLPLILLMVALVVPMQGHTRSAKAQDTFKVAVVMPSASNDLAFSQSMIDALTAIDEEMGDGFEFVFQENTFVVDDAAIALREWASSGEYNLIIAHGSQYGAILEELAPEFPDVSFAWGTDVDTFGYDNVYAYEAGSDQGGFVNGVLAALLTNSNVIGVVGPIEVGDAKLYVDGFKAGVAWVNPEIAVNVNYIQSFSDVALASEAAQAHIANGADVMTGSAQMVVGAVGVAKETGNVLWFGQQSNQTELAPEIVVANQVYHWEVVLKEIIAQVQAGTLGGTSYKLTLENGGLVIEYNEAYALSAFDRFVADAVIQGIIDGTITYTLE